MSRHGRPLFWRPPVPLLQVPWPDSKGFFRWQEDAADQHQQVLPTQASQVAECYAQYDRKGEHTEAVGFRADHCRTKLGGGLIGLNSYSGSALRVVSIVFR